MASMEKELNILCHLVNLVKNIEKTRTFVNIPSSGKDHGVQQLVLKPKKQRFPSVMRNAIL